MRYFIREREVTRSQGGEPPEMSQCAFRFVSGSDDGVAVHGFDSLDGLLSWSKTTTFHSRVEDLQARAKHAAGLSEADRKRIEARQQTMVRRTQKDLADLAKRTTHAIGSPEFFRLAVEGESLSEPPVLHSALLWDGAGYTGSVFPVLSGIPFFTLGGLKNRASSLRVHGVLGLWERTWFRGTNWIFGGIGMAIGFQLQGTGANNNAESALST